VDARDPGALLKVIEMTGAAALVTNPPYGRDHHRIAEAFLRRRFGLSLNQPIRWCGTPRISR
jgi:hypothetical protein